MRQMHRTGSLAKSRRLKGRWVFLSSSHSEDIIEEPSEYEREVACGLWIFNDTTPHQKQRVGGIRVRHESRLCEEVCCTGITSRSCIP